MRCPDCGGGLISVETKGQEGHLLKIEYCSSCGGYFLDQWEANRIPFEEVLLLASKLPKPIKSDIFGGSNLCPHCFIPLEVLHHASIPNNCIVKYCSQCHGNWFQRGQLLIFKRAQRARVEYFKAWNIPISSVFQVLLPLLILVFVGTSIPVTVYLVQKNQEERTMASEYIKSVSVIKTSWKEIILTFSTSKPFSSELEYGTGNFNMKRIPISPVSTTIHQIKLANIPDGKYQYKIILRSDEGRTITSPVGFFEVKN